MEELVFDFQRYCAHPARYSDAYTKQQTALTKAFLLDPHVRPVQLAKKLLFLQLRGFSSRNIEDALEAVDERDYLKFVDCTWNDELQVAHTDPSPVPPGESDAAATNSVGAASADDPFQEELTEESMWRVGANVFCFAGDNSYYHVPLIAIDKSRAEDIMCCAHQLASGEFGPPQYFTTGLKGCVPDQFAPYELVTVGMTIIAEYPNAFRGHYKEAVVLAKSAQTVRDGPYTADLEWVHDSSVLRGMDYRNIRLLYHPKRMFRERKERENERKRLNNTGNRVVSSSSFPYKVTPQMEYLKNFDKHPDLDRGVQPRSLRTAAQFASQYGDFNSDNVRVFPVLPPSQRDLNGVAYGFSLAGIPHHAECPNYLLSDPIVELCRQSLRTDCMFVDPNFPPSWSSLFGPDNAKMSSEITWRRLSEILTKPRLFSVGGKVADLKLGRFTPPWFVNILAALQLVPEMEDMITPGSDGWMYGCYTVRMFVDGAWAFVVVDDFIPCDTDTGKPLTIFPQTGGDVYAVILEKALAKLEGSYCHLKYSRSSICKAWEDFTSNSSEVIHHNLAVQKDTVSENIYSMLSRSVSGVKCCTLHAQTSGLEEFNALGFDRGEFWSVDAASEYVPPGKKVPSYFFHVSRNIQSGLPVPYLESHQERLFRSFPSEAIDLFPQLDDRGKVAYWLPSTTFFRAFDQTLIFWFYNNTQRVCIEGSFAGRPAAGGKMAGPERWLSNPQVFVSLVQPTDAIVELKLFDRRPRNYTPCVGRYLQLHILRGLPYEGALAVETDNIASSPNLDLVDDNEVRTRPSAVVRVTLPAGNYVLIPSVGMPSDERFCIKIFSFSALYGKILN
jgi:hypothetical protein